MKQQWGNTVDQIVLKFFVNDLALRSCFFFSKMGDKLACSVSVLHEFKSAKTLQNKTANTEKPNCILHVLYFHKMHSEVTFLQL